MIRMISKLRNAIRKYLPLIKSPQTVLLLITGLAGFMGTKCPIHNPGTLLGLGSSLFLAISGSTILNMWYDRDIDARMRRTQCRPIPSGEIKPDRAMLVGMTLSSIGIGWAFLLDMTYGMVVTAGLLLDVVIYTIWLKRRTPWSIIWGGLSGGMPILAGRVLGFGSIDWIGISLALGVLFWIPTHIMTFSIRHFEDYQKAGVPTFPASYGFETTRVTIAISSVLAAVFIGLGTYGIGLTVGYLRILIVLSVGLFGLALSSSAKKSESLNFSLFKYASIYMLSAMLLMIVDIL
jgi:protoheme IX farnesyltransferase